MFYEVVDIGWIQMSAVMESWLPRHWFNADDLGRMYESGILGSGDRVELIEGQIIDMTDCLGPAARVTGRQESKAMDAVPYGWIPFHRFSERQYYRMAEIGLFAPDARVELIEGVIIDMAPIGSAHCGAVGWLNQMLCRTLQKRALVWPQNVVKLGEFSHPQPDITLLDWRRDFYRSAHPGPPETLLVIEVSDSSLQTDQMVKVPLFAHFEVPEMWVVDLVHERLHMYREPRDGDYTQVSSVEKPGVTELSALPGVAVDLSDLFG
jgi:Uma2 family endonuclease